jgi:hypothetical protein
MFTVESVRYKKKPASQKLYSVMSECLNSVYSSGYRDFKQIENCYASYIFGSTSIF